TRTDRARPRRRQGAQGVPQPGPVLRQARRRAGEALAAAEADRREAGGAMRRFALRIGVAALLALAMGSAVAQPIDYDPRRASELRACDDHQNHGRTEQARTCYS